jgi:hypothetical protein
MNLFFKRIFITVTLLFSCSIYGQTWTQVGAQIDGTFPKEGFGHSVSLSGNGNIMAVGTPNNYGDFGGQVKIYQNISNVWTLIGKPINGEKKSDGSGFSISLSKDGAVVAIGAYQNDGYANDAGHVRIYRNISGTWTKIGSDIDGKAEDEISGQAVSINADGSIVAIGAIGNSTLGAGAGQVRIYENINNVWKQVGQGINGEAAYDNFGKSVSISDNGSVVAIGAYGNNASGSEAGHARVYENVSGTWIQIGRDIDGEAAGDRSGISISLSGDGAVVAVGSDDNSGNGYRAGHVRVYKNELGSWTQIGRDIDGEFSNDQFGGSSVSLNSDGSILAAGASFNHNTGHVRVFENLEDTWIQVGSDINGILYKGDFGKSVSINSDGSVVVAGGIGSGYNYDAAGYVNVWREPCRETHDTIYPITCSAYSSPSGKIWEISNTYKDTILNVAGCDSILTIYLTIDSIEAYIISDGSILNCVTNDQNLEYQWLDCDNNYSQILGEKLQNFAAVLNGSYSIEVSNINNCKDTAECEIILTVGIEDNHLDKVRVYLDYSTSVLNVELGRNEKGIEVTIFDITGKKVLFDCVKNTDRLTYPINEPSGVYFIQLDTGSKLNYYIKFIKP